MPAFRGLFATLFVSSLALGACDGGVSETTSLTIKLKGPVEPYFRDKPKS